MSPEQRANSRNAVLAGFLGWTLDAFDFFILTYVLVQVGAEFHKSVAQMTMTITASLMMRPVGAVIFGLLADRYGRRLPLILDVLFYSVVEVLSGFAPTYRTFLILRLLYGIGMGGEWGVGASLAMESVPAKWRGVLSGVLQEGYALGNLLAAVAFWTVFPHWGWRPMFFIGGLPALLTLFIRAKVKESDAWKASAVSKMHWRDYFRAVAMNWKRFLYLVLLMTMMNFMSHGTQDLYPTFLQQQHHFGARATAIISVISMVGAITGGILVGLISDHFGRRRAMAAAALLALLLVPAWVFAPSMLYIAGGAFLMQFMVQGAWGVVPAHINELSPGALRGFFPGFAYQLGVLFASRASNFEALMTRQFTYAQAMGLFAAVVFLLGAIVIAAGPEAHRISFGSSETVRPDV
ncbi:MAG TPA: MFS transporter [Candidatus Acidoferrales bacterium]|nr:MFS transporter [Candidatus Acidoferrales bacterium]